MSMVDAPAVPADADVEKGVVRRQHSRAELFARETRAVASRKVPFVGGSGDGEGEGKGEGCEEDAAETEAAAETRARRAKRAADHMADCAEFVRLFVLEEKLKLRLRSTVVSSRIRRSTNGRSTKRAVAVALDRGVVG